MAELQELLDEWVVAVWQNRPHDGLRHPLTPGRPLTPNEMYAALVEITGFVAVPLAPDDYIELMPATWRAIHNYGIKLNNRIYQRGITRFAHANSGIAQRKGLWEIHYDPYDVTHIWVRNHRDGGWITVPWRHLDTAPVPFGDLAWEHAHKLATARGHDPVTEQQIAAAAAALLDKAEAGPLKDEQTTPRERRVIGRTRATTARTRLRPTVEPSPPPDPDTDPDLDDTPPPEVTPPSIFDARQEALRRW